MSGFMDHSAPQNAFYLEQPKILGAKRLLAPGGRESKRSAPSPVEAQSPRSKSPIPCPNDLDHGSMVCFGSLCDIPVQIRQDPSVSSHLATETLPCNDSYVGLDVLFIGDYCWIKKHGGEPFGCFPARTSQGLKRLIKAQLCVDIEGVISTVALEKARSSWKKSGRSASSRIDVIIYGHNHAADTAGKALTSSKLFLQPPTVDLRQLPYDNPQYLKLPGVSDLHISLPEEESTQPPLLLQQANGEATSSEIESILDHIPQHRFLRGVSTDERITATLRIHQKEAVDFMTMREVGNLHPELSLWRPNFSPNGPFSYKNVITGTKSSEMEDILGGILADEMGLGKTLSMLAIIVASLERALEFAVTRTKGELGGWSDVVPSKSTLVVVPSSLLLENWSEEIMKHVLPGSISVYRFHGAEKRIALPDLLRHDIVLTTYATISADFCRGQSLLNRIEWYRLVLDEAHSIRNPSTRQFRAVNAIPSHLRWCLTGTPVQNTLEDLGALVKFLRVPVLSSAATFRRYVTVPIHLNAPGRFSNLKKLLASLCLRRTKSLLNLPDAVTVTRKLQLTESEWKAYHDFGEDCKRAIDLAISGHSMKKANQYVIQAILGMRLFCNDGPTAFSKKWHGLPSDPEEALSYLQACGKSVCVNCDTEIMTMYNEGDRSSGALTTCQHLICGECLPSFEKDLDESLQEGLAECPHCGVSRHRASFIVDPSEAVKAKTATRVSYPTKLMALLRDVQDGNDIDKCVVFSYWKKSLDIIAELFSANEIPFFRIHGSIPAARRSKILSDFEQSTSVRVLLITFGTGAVGINKLVVANRIHIVEPQWNPSVESQAIGRVLRLGQQKSVTIVRYIVEDTVEEAVQSRQLRKLQLAGGGFSLGKDEHTSQRVQEIMELLCPTKPHD